MQMLNDISRSELRNFDKHIIQAQLETLYCIALHFFALHCISLDLPALT